MAGEDILLDSNFLKLASKKMEAEEFAKVVGENCGGWREKRRLVEGLKVLQEKVAAIEQKVHVAKAVGKAKGQLEYDDQKLADAYEQYNLRDKVTGLNAAIQTMIDESRLTASEIPVCLAHLQARLDKAKAGGKAQAQEKLEKMIKHVRTVGTVEVPVAHLPELFNMHKDYDGITKLQAKKAASQTDADRKRIAKKDKVWEQMKELEARSRMWFETQSEFEYRLHLAIEERTKNLAEELKREAEEEAERDRIAFEELLAKRKADAAAKEEAKAKEMADKIAAKRAEAALKPVKAVPKKKVVEKVKKPLNPFELFKDPHEEQERLRAEEALRAEQEEEWEDTEASPEPPEPEKKAAAPKAAEQVPEVKAEPKVEPKVEAKPKPVPKKKERPVLENKWGAPAAPAPEQEGEEAELTMAEAARVADILDGPSLSDAIKGPEKKADQKEKIPPPQPKKKEKKKVMKMSASDLGFEC